MYIVKHTRICSSPIALYSVIYYSYFHSWRGSVILSLLVLIANCAELTQCNPSQCDDNFKSPLKDYIVRKDRGGLNGMCKAAEDTRRDIIGEELPYGLAAERAREW